VAALSLSLRECDGRPIRRNEKCPRARHGKSMETLISDPFVSILFITFGFALLFSELFIVSFGILGTIGTGAAIFGIFGFFHQDRIALGVVAIITTVAFVVFSIRFWLKKIVLKETLTPNIAVATDGDAKADLVGQEGTTLSELRPAGLAYIDGRKQDVVSRGQFIAEGVTIRVVDVTGNRIVVIEQTAEVEDAAAN